MNQPQTPNRVVVTGIGAITNVGLDADAAWEALLAGACGISPIHGEKFDRFGMDAFSVKIGGQIHDFDAAATVGHRESKRLDRFAQLGIAAALQAVERSGIDFDACDRTRCGAVIGSGVGGIQTIEDALHTMRDKNPSRMSPFTVPRLMANAVAGDVSIRFGIEGYTTSHTTACASSGHSIGDAMRQIRDGHCDVVLAGGAEGAVSPLCLSAFMVMKAMSTRNDDPAHASRPFDKDRDGFVLAEGAAVLVLESEAHAQKRGANILCELLGCGVSADAHHITAPDPNGKGAAAAMRYALRDAQLNPTDIDYVNAHGTSTPLGDQAEVAAAYEVFGDHARKSAGGKLLMSSTKSMIGHTLGASGAVECISCIGAIRHGTVTPTVNLESPDPEFEDIDLVPNTPRDAKVDKVLNNTFGFGGHNVSLVLGRYEG